MGLGEWELPYEAVTAGTTADVAGLLVDSVDVIAATYDSPIGRLPMLVLGFKSSALPLEAQPPSLMFVGTPDVLRSVRQLLNQSIDGAIAACGG